MPVNDDVLKHWHQVSAALDEVLALPATERNAWLARRRADNPSLASRVASMLERSDRLDRNFLVASSRLVDIATAAFAGVEDQPGGHVGPYRLIRAIGTGGMGVVWLAERTEGVTNRKVALKLPRYGWSKEISARLQYESAVLATLEHPGIARLYDAGVSIEGRPFLAMEYVEGIPIDVYCKSDSPNLKRTLALLVKVAKALSYAHGKLVVHSDLKPGNILVMPDGDVRVLDFGIARILNDSSIATTKGSGELPPSGFTPQYASPEQLRRDRVDVATDVYSLGVVAYELVSGRRPDDSYGRRGAKPGMHMPPPSASSVSTSVPASDLRGDVDAVFAKALAPQAPARYQTMEALASDLERLIRGEPVAARPLTWMGHSASWVRRNRLASAAVTVALLAVLAGFSISVWQAHLARREAARAEEVKEFIATVLGGAVPVVGERGKVLAVDLLEKASERLERELAGNPRAAAEIGLILADSFKYLGRREQAERIMQFAARRAEAEFGQAHMITLRAKEYLNERLLERDAATALRQCESLIPVAESLRPRSHSVLADLYNQRARALTALGDKAAALAAHERTAALAESLLGPLDRTTVAYLAQWGQALGTFGAYDRQMEVSKDAYRRARVILGGHRPDVILSLVERQLGSAERYSGRLDEAIPVLRQVVADFRVLDGFPSNRLRLSLAALANAELEQGEFANAFKLADEAMHSEPDSEIMPRLNRHYVEATHARTRIFSRKAGGPSLGEGLSAGAAESAVPPIPEHRITLGMLAAYDAVLMGDQERAEAQLSSGMRQLQEEWPHRLAENLQLRLMNARLNSAVLDPDAAGLKGALALALTHARPWARIALRGELALTWLARGDAARFASEASTCMDEARSHGVRVLAQLHECAIAWSRWQFQRGKHTEAVAALAPLTANWAVANAGSPWHGEAMWWLARAQASARVDTHSRRNLRDGLQMLRASRYPWHQALAKDRKGAG